MGSSPVKIADALKDVRRLSVETAPFIYYVERYPAYVDKMRVVFLALEAGQFEVVTSTVTLTEVLTKPLRAGDSKLVKTYREMLQTTRNVILAPVSVVVAERAADLRARNNLKTPDALQVAVAIHAGCDAFLSNDSGLKRVTEIRVLLLDELE
jgi:predicted nucleic acid-binding protein